MLGIARGAKELGEAKVVGPLKGGSGPKNFLRSLFFIFHFSFFILFSGCTVSYTFTGAQIPMAAKTFSVAYFPNNAMYVSPTLANALTEGLRDRMMRQTRLSQVAEEGDLSFEGEITSDVEAPASVTANEDNPTAMNRITVTVTVRFNNVHAPEWSFQNGKTFSAFYDYPASELRPSIEDGAVEDIVDKLVDQIFNASVANW